MLSNSPQMRICLWFDNQAEEAAQFYTSIFKDSSIGKIVRYTKAGEEFHHQPEGAVMTVEFNLNGMNFLGLNGGPLFKFSEAVSVMINCETQEEIDWYWQHLTDGGQEGPCGWLKDKFGVSWQIAPKILAEILSSADADKVQRVTNAFMQMKKFDIDTIVNA